MSSVHHDPRQALALAELRSRGEVQTCWSCGKELLASARKPNPQSITVGHYTDVDLGLTDPFDPANYGPQCAPCNYRGGAHRTNAKRRGETGLELTTSPDWT
ncbi:hypothetical protein [Microbacterium xylanilyticum]